MPLGLHSLAPALAALSVLLSPAVALRAQGAAPARRAITWDDVAGLRAVADPQLSPDGSRVLYTVRVTEDSIDVSDKGEVSIAWENVQIAFGVKEAK